MKFRHLMKFENRRSLTLFLLLGCALPAHAWRSSLYPDTWTPPENKEFYTDQLIQDFSYAGYRRGEVALPNITGPVIDVVAGHGADPSGTNDSTAAIQAAIDATAAAGGGVVYLPTGNYKVSPQGSNSYCLNISSSNIVLRGDGATNTFLTNTETNMRFKEVIRVGASVTIDPAVSLTADLTNPTRRLPVASPESFSVGDFVLLKWAFTDEWIAEHNQQSYWSEAGGKPADARYTREVVAVNQAEGWIEVDVPTRYTMKVRDNARVEKIDGLLTGVGIESLAIGNIQNSGTTWGSTDYLDPTKPAYEVHQSYILEMEYAVDCWITGVESYQPTGNTSTCHMLSNGILITLSFRVTISDCSMSRSQYGGSGGNGYMFRLQYASECLVKNCAADFSRHGLVISHAGTSGNVFLRCEDRETRRSTGDTGSYITGGQGSDHHMHFSHSNLFDQCSVHNSFFTASHRIDYGTIAHGLSSAHGVYWNTSGSGTRYNTIVQSEQGRYGYIIGTSGSKFAAGNPVGGNTAPADILEGIGSGDTLEPQSLHAAQLAKRMQGLLVFMEKDATLGITSAYPLEPSVYNYRIGPATYTWSQISGPTTTFGDDSSVTTTVDLSASGTYVFELSADNGTENVSEQITLTVLEVLIDPLLSDDFESYTSGNDLPLNSTWAKIGQVSGMNTVQNTETVFGSSNKYLKITDTSTTKGVMTLSHETTAALNAVTTIQFDFYEPDNSLGDALNFGYGTGDSSSSLVGFSSSQARILVNLDDGVIGGVSGGTSTSYNLDTAYTLYLIFNDTAASVTYAGRTLAAHTADVWFKPLGGSAGDAVYAGSTAALDNPPAEGTGYFAAFRTFNAATQEVLIDNLSFYEGAAAIPGTFTDWIASYELGGLTGPGDDPDKDGIANIIEAWFGTHPGESNVGLANLASDGTVATFTHPQNENPPADISGYYQWSPNLIDWYAGDGVDGPPGGPTVLFSVVRSGANTTVTATASATMERTFFRAGVIQN